MTDATPTDAVQTPSQDAAPQVPASGQRPRTQKVGRVVSDKMEKTVVVAVDSVRRHPLYHKRMTRTSKFLAHDEFSRCKPGDVVRIEETRPMSKRKRWIVREVLQQGVRI
ncbi:MAG: 30S ribosomal protein S17 [Chloroflexota bacterium]|nr:30S ribosomal protein S17 [Chloroflexota bacterium]